MTDTFYRSFEDRYRGSRELIKSRLKIYLPFVEPLLGKKNISNNRALDLGCGRGEWLELLKECGFIAKGVDLEEGMLEACRQQGLQVEHADALDYLQSQKANSVAVISGFHIAEHLPFDKLRVLIEHSLRVLKSGGLLILETPNPENIVVGTANFYLDPTHERPLPPQLLSFVAEYAGFERVKILRLQESGDLIKSQALSLIDVLAGVSPDYSIVAQKRAAKKTLEKFDGLFSKEYGVSLSTIAGLYEEQLNGKTDAIKSEWEEVHRQNEHLQSKLGVVCEQRATAEAARQQLVLSIQDMQQHLDALGKQNERLQSELGTAREQKAIAEAARQQLVLSTQDMQQHLDTLGKQNKHLRSELDSAHEQKAAIEAVRKQLALGAQEMEQRIKSYRREKAIFNEQYEQLKLHAKWLQDEWDVSKKKIDELNHSSHYWWTEADRLTKELQEFYHSNSWRMTWPLRKLMQFFKWLFVLPKHLFLWIVRLPRRTVRWLLVKVMVFVHKRPALKARAVTWLRKYPRLDARLRRLAQARGLVVAQPDTTPIQTPPAAGNEASTFGVDLSHLSPGARRIYKELKAAIEERQKEGI